MKRNTLLILIAICCLFKIINSMEDSLDIKLILAVKKGESANNIAELTKAGANCNAQDKKGKTALHYAITNIQNYFRFNPKAECTKQYKQRIELLVKAKADIHIQNRKKLTPVHLMVKVSNLSWLIDEVVQSMDIVCYPCDLAKLPDSEIDRKEQFAYQKSTCYELLNLLASSSMHNDNKSVSLELLSPLAMAAQMGNFEAVKSLLVHGNYSHENIQDAIKYADYNYDNEKESYLRMDREKIYQQPLSEFFSKFVNNNKKVVELLLHYLFVCRKLNNNILPTEIVNMILKKCAYNAPNSFIMPKIRTVTSEYQQQAFSMDSMRQGDCILQ